MPHPALLAVSHGTGSAAGQRAVRALVDAVAAHLPDVAVRLGHVDVQQPDVAASLASLPDGEPVVLVPLLLSAGYHVRVDLRRATRDRAGVTVTGALGPDPRLADVLAERLERAGLTDGDAVVLAVAGSSDARANDDCRAVAALLGERLARTVAVGFLAAAEPRLARAVAEARGDRVVVGSYLLAPGYFHDLAVREAGGAAVARPLLDDDEPAASLVELVLDRYRSAVEPALERDSSV
ncbi:sirohydrochlorin chelatase [Microbacterium ulmi]|uniref:Cobalamin biosynthesis protein CbiX n=1 Tax=Microbacterium ulmi TaxID=179095 RepID=A0A7Y2Q205_9MICO|nr:CbiX/SirB N-terminal domain-containing protein [Microbacterium ulmi]NII69252.1 sirohydrochlorin ferrochelatase [Microbacterium ulmi]NNH04932.1 cobalamin biosynthesis protein CbiX [Microbacterium ulmi]